MTDKRLIFGLALVVLLGAAFFMRLDRKRELREGIIKLPSGEQVDRLSDPLRFEELNKKYLAREIIHWLGALLITGYWVWMRVNLGDAPF